MKDPRASRQAHKTDIKIEKLRTMVELDRVRDTMIDKTNCGGVSRLWQVTDQGRGERIKKPGGDGGMMGLVALMGAWSQCDAIGLER